MQEEIAQLSEAYLDAAVSFIVEIRSHELPKIENSLDTQVLPDLDEPYRAGSGNFWITLVDANVVGTVGLVDLGGSQGCLQKMYLHPDYRGTGAALRLLNTLVEWAGLRQIRHIYLGTYSENRAARKFYEKHDFFEVPKDHIPFNFPRSDLEDCFYCRSLSSRQAH